MALDDYYSAQKDVELYEDLASTFQNRISNLRQEITSYRFAIDREEPGFSSDGLAELESRLESAEEALIDANDNLASAREQLNSEIESARTDPTTTVKTPTATNESETDIDTASKYSDPTRIPDPSVQYFDDGSSLRTFDDGSTLATDADGNVTSSPALDVSTEEYTKRSRSVGVPPGAQTADKKAASAQWAGAKDLRVFLRVPQTYLTGPFVQRLTEFGGILFPYTPSISYDNQASYGSVNPVHSNYTQFFFKNSSVGNISITGKFTVQNEKEAIVWLSIQHLLRAITKMRWGKDANAGSPPPVCRLEGYGDFMLRNVPVVVSSFKIDYPDNVDYISVKTGVFKTTLVPTISTISLTLNPSYSRKELQDYSVDAWLSGSLAGKGYL